MKNLKKIWLLLLVAINTHGLIAQAIVDPVLSTRSQKLNQYTSVFICSPNSGTIIQDVHDDSFQPTFANSDRFYKYENGAYVELPQDESVTVMEPGRGYVLQLGGNGTYTDIRLDDRVFDFSGGNANSAPVSAAVTNNQFNLLGNPFSDFLNLDLFLLSSNNKTKVKGPIMLWSHNTIISSANINPNDPTSTYRNSANDFALYNVLGGVAAGRQISTSADNDTQTGIQTPDGKICLGTGFGIYGISSGNVVYDNTMKTTGDNNNAQSFRLINPELSQKEVANKSTAIVPSVRSRIWLNLERGTPPSSGNNTNPLKQALVGYSPCYGTDCPTNGDSDRVFDAETVTADSNPSMDLYSFASGSTKHLAIQGRKDFANSDSFKIGYKATAGTHTFTATADGMFTSTPYYIYDANDGQYHTLPYTFTAPGGTEDNRFKIVFENLVGITIPVGICGGTLQDIENVVWSTQIAGATGYKFEVRENSTNNLIGLFDGNAGAPFKFRANVSGVLPNTTYNIRVATYKVDNNWMFGNSCLITTPPPPTSFLRAPTCSSTISSVSTRIDAQEISNKFLISATKYRFNATIGNGTTVYQTPETTYWNTDLTKFIGMPITPNTQYNISVDIFWDNQWRIGTNICSINTGNTLAPRLTSNSNEIFEVKSHPNPFSDNFKLELNTSSNNQVNVKVFDMVGRLIENSVLPYEQANAIEYGSSLNSGIYNIVVSQGDNIKTLRVIKR